jgi:hypothetical protein
MCADHGGARCEKKNLLFCWHCCRTEKVYQSSENRKSGNIMINFTITPKGDEFLIEPFSDMAKSLKEHCRYKGIFLYPTYSGAVAAVARMDQAIENRQGRPWLNFRKQVQNCEPEG